MSTPFITIIMSDSDIVANQELVANALNKHLHRKPSHYGRRSRSPYFSLKNAKWIRQFVDMQIESRKDIVCKYADFNLVPSSLDAKVRQSIQYLLDHLDGDNKYAEWREGVQISQTATGILVHYVENGVGCDGEAVMIAPEDKKPIWIRRMENYLESTSIDPFIMEGLAMSEEQALSIRSQLKELQGIQFSVTRVAIKIIKI